MTRFITSQWKAVYLLWITLMITPYSSSSGSPDSSGNFMSPLSGLLNTFKIPHDQTLKSMTEASQVWRRKPGQERWEMPEVKLGKTEHDTVQKFLNQLGLVDELMPESANYHYALLLGATVPRMERRLNHLASLWKKGVRFKRIIFLVGQRPLADGIDKVDTLIARTIGKQATGERANAARPLTETEGAKLVFETSDLPPAMRLVPVEFVDTPRTWQHDHWQRANTRDTLKQWLGRKPEPGKTLVISDQPHAFYQAEVVKQELPDSFAVDAAAQESDPDTQLSIYLDALALWLHNRQKRTSRYN
ncbi:MAG: hypothetical protein ACR2PT_17520 [Endozoicomonas sp.]